VFIGWVAGKLEGKLRENWPENETHRTKQEKPPAARLLAAYFASRQRGKQGPWRHTERLKAEIRALNEVE